MIKLVKKIRSLFHTEMEDYIKISSSYDPIITSWEVFFKEKSYAQIQSEILELTRDTDFTSQETTKRHVERLWQLPKGRLRGYALVNVKKLRFDDAIEWDRQFLDKLYSQYGMKRYQLVTRYGLPDDIAFPNDLVLNGGLDVLDQKLVDQIKGGGVVLDCGAFRGETTAVYHNTLLPEKIIAFEPIPENYQFLLKTAQCGELTGVVVPFNIGVYNKDGELYFSDNLDSSTVIREIPQGVNSKEMIMIKVRTIDSVMSELNLKDIRFIKLDVEDSEIEALEGAEKTIKRDKPIIFTSIYHSANEFFGARKLIDSWNLGYKHSIRDMDPTNMFTELFLISIPE